MKIRTLLISFLSLTILHCSSSDNPVEDNPIVDTTKPVLTVNGLSGIIEKFTKISVSIVDESAVETKLIHNAIELNSSTEKQFDISINPYVLPIGQTDFTIVSKDALGNETSKTFSVEIKHLLLEYEFNANEIDENQHWLFFNSLDGTELESTIISNEKRKKYTDKIISEEYILISKADHILILNGRLKFLNISTYKILLGSSKLPEIEQMPLQFNHTLELKINNVPFENQPRYFATGYGYSASPYSGNAQYSTVTIKHNADRPIYLRKNFVGLAPNLIGKKENYNYYSFTPDTGNTNKEIDLSQFSAADDNMKIDLPEHDVGSFSCIRNGFKDDESVSQNKGNLMYDAAEPDQEYFNYIDLPIISGLSKYRNLFSYKKNGATYLTSCADEAINLNMPNWIANVEVANTSIKLSANNSDVDYYSITLKKRLSTNTGGQIMSRNMNWIYNVFAEDGTEKILPRLPVPNLIIEFLEDSFFHTTNDLELNNGIKAYDYIKYKSYDEIMEWVFLKSNLLKTNENDYRIIEFANP